MTTYADIQDVSLRLGRPISDAYQISQIETWLDDVEAVIVARFKRAGLVLADQIALDDPPLATVVRIEAEATIRKMRADVKADGPSSITRSVDDAQITERNENMRVEDWILDTDWSDLLPSFSSSAFSTRPGFEPDTFGWPSSWA